MSVSPPPAATKGSFRDIPRPPGNGIIRNVTQLSGDILGFLEKTRKTTGDFYAVDLPFVRLVVISDAEVARYVLQENHRNYKKSFGYEILKLFLGKGLLTNEGDDWKRHRRLAQPAFYRKATRNLIQYMSEEADDMVQRLKPMQGGAAFNIEGEMMEVTLRIVARTLFGADVGDQIGTIRKSISLLNRFAMERINSPIRLPLWLPTPRAFRFRKASGNMDRIMYDIIRQRRRSGKEYHDLTGMLMAARYEENGEPMDDLQLRDELMTIFVAGHETTANAMAWTLNLLVQHPEVVEKLREEANEVLKGKTAAYEDLKQLTYTLQVVEESMRLFPPAWVLGRRNIKKDVIGGYEVEADTNILIAISEMHRHPGHWDNPLTFNPENFAPEKKKSIGKYAYFPFGAGPRMCIGNHFALMEMQILLATLVQHFSFEPDPGFVAKPDPLITLRPKHGIRLKLV